jgi:cytochrome c-type biogenesis protein CcmH
MTVFWILAAGLTVLALCLLLPALLRQRSRQAGTLDASKANLAILRAQLAQLDTELAAGSLDAEQHRSARAEIVRRVLDEEAVAETPRVAGSARTTAIWMGLGVPVFALVVYGFLGNFGALSTAPLASGPDGEAVTQQMLTMADTLAKRMQERPDDLVGWTLLARTYGALQRYPEASRAYARAIALSPKDAQLLADHADVLAMTQDRSVAGEPTRLIEQALLLDPKNVKALALAGSAAFERKDFAAAIGYWTQARQLAPPESEFVADLDRSLAEARESAPGAPPATSASATPAGSAASSTASSAGAAPLVKGRVSLAPALAARTSPTDTVFIFARAAEGPRMPLAILKRQVSELPISFTLDDSLAMSPQMKLSNFSSVVVGARISKSGQAMPTPGDLTGQSMPVKTDGSPVELVIDGVQP